MSDSENWLTTLSTNYQPEDIRAGSYNTRIAVRAITLGFMAFVTAMLGTSALTNPVNIYSMDALIAGFGAVATFLHIWEYRKDNSYGLVLLENSETRYAIARKQDGDGG